MNAEKYIKNHGTQFYCVRVKLDMVRNVTFAVGSVIVYTVIYLLMLQSGSTQIYGFLMLFFFPIVICRLIYTILKDGKYKGPKSRDEEFGYQDKPEDQLKAF